MYTYSDELYSDLHKDVYGSRPGEYGYARWNSMAQAEKQEHWDYLCSELETQLVEEKNRDVIATLEFESLVAETIQMGARDRATALRWIAAPYREEVGCQLDPSYICYLMDLPYSLEKEFSFITKEWR